MSSRRARRPVPAQEECRGKRNNDPPKREFWPVARRGTAVMLNRLMGGTPRKSSELLKKELLELQTQVDTEQRELMRLQTAKKAEEAEEADRQAATVYRLHESQSDDSQSDAGQSDDSQSDGDQSDDSQSDGGPSDGGPSDDSQSDGGQSDGGQSEESGSESERRYGWPPTLEERAAAINAAVWGTSRQHTQSHPEAEQAPQPRVPRPPEQHQPQMPVQASPHRAAAEAEYRAAMAAALEAAETAARLRLESESESDNERRDSDSWTPTLEEATKATERAAAINAAAWSASRQQHTQAQSPPQAARAAAAPARWFQPTEPAVQPQPQVPLHYSPEGKEQEQARKERVVAVVARWQQQNGPWLRTLLAALDAPELGAILGLCKSVCTKLPAGSDEGAVRRAYLRAIKRVHPDKVSAQAPAQERFAAAAIFDALREANERNESAAELPERRMRPERRRRPS